MVKAMRKVRTGSVVRMGQDKTAVVEMVWKQRHRLYRKQMRRVARFHVHDPLNQCQLGDVVRIEETRPISKSKRWRLLEIMERRQVAEVQPIELEADAQIEVAVEELAELDAAEETIGLAQNGDIEVEDTPIDEVEEASVDEVEAEEAPVDEIEEAEEAEEAPVDEAEEAEEAPVDEAEKVEEPSVDEAEEAEEAPVDEAEKVEKPSVDEVEEAEEAPVDEAEIEPEEPLAEQTENGDASVPEDEDSKP